MPFIVRKPFYMCCFMIVKISLCSVAALSTSLVLLENVTGLTK